VVHAGRGVTFRGVLAAGGQATLFVDTGAYARPATWRLTLDGVTRLSAGGMTLESSVRTCVVEVVTPLG
jgi:hypothetical protein